MLEWFRSAGGFDVKPRVVLIAFLALAASWLVPNHYKPWTSFYSELVAAVGGALLCLAASAGTRQARFPLLSVLLASTALLPWLQWANGKLVFSGDAVMVSLYLAGAALLVWAGYELRRDGQTLAKGIASSLLLAAIVSTGLAMYQWLGLSGLNIWAVEVEPATRASANISQPNHLATLIVLGLIALKFSKRSGWVGKTAAFTSTAFLLTGLALSGSRTPLAIAVALAACYLLKRRGRDPSPPERIDALPLALLTSWYLLCFLGLPVVADWLLLSDPSHPVSARLGAGLRPLLWKQMTTAIGASPWFGWGWLQTATAQAAVAISSPGLEYATYSHNLFLDLLLWNGIPIGSGLIVLLSIALLAGFRQANCRESRFWFGVALAITVHALLEYPHAYWYFLVLWSVAMGALVGGRGVKVPRTAVALAMCTTMVVVGIVSRDYLIVERDAWKLQMSLARIGTTTAASADKAPVVVLDQLGAMLDAGWSVEQGVNSAAQLQQLERVTLRYPDKFFLSMYAIAMAERGDVQRAAVELTRYRAIYGEEALAMLLQRIKGSQRVKDPNVAELVGRFSR